MAMEAPLMSNQNVLLVLAAPVGRLDCRPAREHLNHRAETVWMRDRHDDELGSRRILHADIPRSALGVLFEEMAGCTVFSRMVAHVIPPTQPTGLLRSARQLSPCPCEMLRSRQTRFSCHREVLLRLPSTRRSSGFPPMPSVSRGRSCYSFQVSFFIAPFSSLSKNSSASWVKKFECAACGIRPSASLYRYRSIRALRSAGSHVWIGVFGLIDAGRGMVIDPFQSV